MLVNGQSKQRMTKQGGSRAIAKWLVNFLSSSELSLSDHMRSGGKKSTAGQELRIVDIPADAGTGLGAFENIHGAQTASEFANLLIHAARKSYGTAGIEFIERLVDHRTNGVMKLITAWRQEFINQLNLSSGTDGQVHRVANRFSLVGAAGELATSYGLTGCQPGESINAVLTCFGAWLESRGGIGSAEEKACLAQVALFFEQHGDDRFSPLPLYDNDATKTINRAGFSEFDGGDRSYFVFKEVCEQEILKGYDVKTAAAWLKARDWLKPDHEGNRTVSKKLPGIGKKTRVYHFTSSVLQSD